MGQLQGIIAGLGQLFGAKPKESQDFWDRMMGYPVYNSEQRAKERDQEYGRRAVEYQGRAGIDTDEYGNRAAIDTGELQLRGGDATGEFDKRAAIGTREGKNMINAGIDAILPRSAAETQAGIEGNRAQAGAAVEDAQSTNPILQALGQAKSYGAIVEMLNAQQAAKQGQADPARGTAAGLAYNKGIADLGQTTAVTQGQRIGNTLASAGIPYVAPKMEAEIDNTKGRTAAMFNEQNRVNDILPLQKQLIQSQIESMGQEGNRPIPVGGNAVLIPYVDENGNRQWKVNVPAMEAMQKMGAAGGAPTGAANRPPPVDTNVLKEIQAGRGR